jgi:hypothetical protein
MGIVFVVVGAWVVVQLGPSGEAQFSATSKAPGAIVVPPDVLNAVDTPVHVEVTRGDRGAVLLAAAPGADARAILATSAVSTVSAVHYPAGGLDLRASGAGPLTNLSTADVWRLTSRGVGSAALVVDQTGAPETVVVASGDSTALKDVTVTLTWADRAWFFEALVMGMLGAVLAAFAFNDLWQGRVIAVPGVAAANATSEATT